MNEIKYIDDDSVNKIKEAVKGAKASMEIEGFYISNEDEIDLINELSSNEKIKLLLKKSGEKNARRYMG